MRMHGHAAHDDMRYVPPELLAEWAAARPDRAAGAARRGARRRRRGAARGGRGRGRGGRGGGARSRRCRIPADATRGVFAEGEAEPLGDGRAPWSGFAPRRGGELMPTMTYLQAISDALREQLRADVRVLVMGEDVGAFGGAFKVTDGFVEEFGEARVMDTPLAESAIVGTAVGAAVVGHAAGLRDAVRRLRLVRLRPARQRRRQDALPLRPRGADRRAAAERRRLLRRAVPLAEPGGVVHARARDQGARALDAGGREGTPDRRDPRSEPGRLPRAQAPLPPREGRGARGHLRDADDRAARARGDGPRR